MDDQNLNPTQISTPADLVMSTPMEPAPEITPTEPVIPPAMPMQAEPVAPVEPIAQFQPAASVEPAPSNLPPLVDPMAGAPAGGGK